MPVYTIDLETETIKRFAQMKIDKWDWKIIGPSFEITYCMWDSNDNWPHTGGERWFTSLPTIEINVEPIYDITISYNKLQRKGTNTIIQSDIEHSKVGLLNWTWTYLYLGPMGL